MELLAGLNREGMTVIMVTHNLAHTDHAGRHLRLRDGLLVDAAAAAEGPAEGAVAAVGAGASGG
jgi:ABC-type lipoprotein export system ATPase subunit